MVLVGACVLARLLMALVRVRTTIRLLLMTAQIYHWADVRDPSRHFVWALPVVASLAIVAGASLLVLLRGRIPRLVLSVPIKAMMI